MSVQLQNVHQFDRQLQDRFRPQRVYTSEERQAALRRFVQELRTPVARAMATRILQGGAGNVDHANHIDAGELLVDILHRPYQAVLGLLEEQLVDCHRLGQCAQGRTTRLLQIWLGLV